jgi:hypothetical protein
MVLLAYVLISPQVPTNTGLMIACLLCGFVAGVAAILLFLVWARVARVPSEKNFLALPTDQWQVGPWRVRITPEGFENTSALANSMYRWEVIWSMGQTHDYLVYMISSERGVVVPRRAFISDEHFDDFAESARRYRRQATEVLDAEAAPAEEEAPEPERPSTDIRL